VVAALSGEAAAQEKVTFDDHVQRLLAQHCGKCHGAERQRAGLDVSTYGGVLKGSSGGVVVESGDPDASTLFLAITHQREPTMPPGSGKLPDRAIETIRAWISGGLLENAGSQAKAKRKSGLAPIASGAVGRPAEPLPLPEHLSLEPAIVTARPGIPGALAASPWAPLVALGGQRQVLLYDTRTFELRGVLPFPEGQPTALSFTSDGRLLVAGGGRAGASGRAVVFDPVTGERVLEAGDEPDVLLAADLSADRSLLLFGGPQRVVKLVDASDGAARHQIRKHTDWLMAARFSPDGVLFASGDRNGGLAVFEAQSGREMHTLVGHTAAITALAWRDDSNVLASASEDGSIKMWEMFEGRQVRSFAGHGGGVLALAMAHDGRLASGGRDRTVKVWSADGQPMRTIERSAPVVGVAFDEASGRLIAADAAGDVALFDLGEGALLAALPLSPPSLATRLADAIAARDVAKLSMQGSLAALTAAEQADAPFVAAVAAARAEEAAAVAQAAPAEEAVAAARAASDSAAAAVQAASTALDLERAAAGGRNDALAAATQEAAARNGSAEAARQQASEREVLHRELAQAASAAAVQSAAAPDDVALRDLANKAAEAAALAEKAAIDAAERRVVAEAAAGAAAERAQVAAAEVTIGAARLTSLESASAAAAADQLRTTDGLVAAEATAAAPRAAVAAARERVAAALAAGQPSTDSVTARRNEHAPFAAAFVAGEQRVARWQAAEMDRDLAVLARERRVLLERRSEAEAERTMALERIRASEQELLAAKDRVATIPDRANSRAAELVAARGEIDGATAAASLVTAHHREKAGILEEWQARRDELAAAAADLPPDAPLSLALARVGEAIAELDRDLKLARSAVETAEATIRSRREATAAVEARHVAEAATDADLPAQVERLTAQVASCRTEAVPVEARVGEAEAALAALDQRMAELTRQRDERWSAAGR
jgi:hypothetical protein